MKINSTVPLPLKERVTIKLSTEDTKRWTDV